MLRLPFRAKRKKIAALALADRARDARDWAAAARHYREAVRQRPADPAIWVQLGHALKESGKLAEAEEAYRRSIQIDDRIADTHLQLGHLLKIRGRRDDAVAAYLRALGLDPAMPHAALELLALCWERIGPLDAGWRQHVPAFLNAIDSLRAVAHEQARLAQEVDQLRRELDRLKKRDAA